ncbi:hypothetical protein LB566_02625 [Mesorhizobium sp. CA13]|uniref:hypothetical protein n=1 Tax=Mesorhizobium sp. CA13 TaxID=2876643 RepID=UPI001CCB4405|nr:hypothetical protein [Mesorhizobium sp. CA13]MBZ9852677.1 hypothetical protein [Mesorhizobium sp. CA13]
MAGITTIRPARDDEAKELPYIEQSAGWRFVPYRTSPGRHAGEPALRNAARSRADLTAAIPDIH